MFDVKASREMKTESARGLRDFGLQKKNIGRRLKNSRLRSMARRRFGLKAESAGGG